MWFLKQKKKSALLGLDPGGMVLERLWKDLDSLERLHRTGTNEEGQWRGNCLTQAHLENGC